MKDRVFSGGKRVKQKDLNYFRELLLDNKARILNRMQNKSLEDLQISPDDLPDEADVANHMIGQGIGLSIRSKELKELRLIEEALHRIEAKEYGRCEECDEEISRRRLENRPVTTLCITHAEEFEREHLKRARTTLLEL